MADRLGLISLVSTTLMAVLTAGNLAEDDFLAAACTGAAAVVCAVVSVKGYVQAQRRQRAGTSRGTARPDGPRT
ncbi:hypothetical protein AB0I72_25330 [Nocardiopsis sp. NPDC049922]|uniref:hypothetical protein n=1 Tax=Nocardiopsis sp. NPDC049922 TaxID=3155157 RepID=UPI0033CD2653